MGDLHGAYKALIQCLERANFNYQQDVLIQLGDVVDGYDEAYECVEELLKIRNSIFIKGNHDDWLNEFIETGLHPAFWTYGGRGTLISYLKHTENKGVYFASRTGYKTSLNPSDIPSQHRDFFKNQRLFYIDEKNRCFVHGGFNRALAFSDQKPSDYYWDRNLWKDAIAFHEWGGQAKDYDIATQFSEIYIGHSPMTHWGSDQPHTIFHITNMDTGAGHNGRLTIMDIDSKEYWQSDLLTDLYPRNFRD